MKRPLSVIALACACLVVASPAAAKPKPTPVIFVHGGSGSAQQFETNAMRFISFLTAIDNHIPSSPDASGTVAVTETMRGNRRHTITTNVPNWPAGAHTVSVYFKDYAAKAYKEKR